MNAAASHAQYGVRSEHHFCGDRPGWKPYIKETFIPAGVALPQHVHEGHDHFGVLVSGSVILTENGVARPLIGYQTVLIKAGVEHRVEAVTDTIWLCAWATQDDDPATVDTSLVKGD